MDLPNPCMQRQRQLKQMRRDALRRARKRPGRTVAFCGVRGRARTQAETHTDAEGKRRGRTRDARDARDAHGTHTGRTEGRTEDAQRDADARIRGRIAGAYEPILKCLATMRVVLCRLGLQARKPGYQARKSPARPEPICGLETGMGSGFAFESPSQALEPGL